MPTTPAPVCNRQRFSMWTNDRDAFFIRDREYPNHVAWIFYDTVEDYGDDDPEDYFLVTEAEETAREQLLDMRRRPDYSHRSYYWSPETNAGGRRINA